jgi:hypothetical protein
MLAQVLDDGAAAQVLAHHRGRGRARPGARRDRGHRAGALLGGIEASSWASRITAAVFDGAARRAVLALTKLTKLGGRALADGQGLDVARAPCSRSSARASPRPWRSRCSAGITARCSHRAGRGLAAQAPGAARRTSSRPAVGSELGRGRARPGAGAGPRARRWPGARLHHRGRVPWRCSAASSGRRCSRRGPGARR